MFPHYLSVPPILTERYKKMAEEFNKRFLDEQQDTHREKDKSLEGGPLP